MAREPLKLNHGQNPLDYIIYFKVIGLWNKKYSFI